MTSPASARPLTRPSRAVSDSQSGRRPRVDPLGPILALGRREGRIGILLGLAGTLIVHGAPAAEAATSLVELRDFAGKTLTAVRARLGLEIDVDTLKPPPPPPPPPPAPEPEPVQPERHVAPKAASNEPPPPPPAPAQAGKVLTQEPNPDEPVDLTGEGFVTGNAERFVGGVTAREGTSKQPVRSAAATPTGVPGGTGTAPAPPPPGEDKSRAAAPDPSVGWKDCGFPPEADIEGINEARVGLAVTVGPDGRAKSVSVVKDPGYGFGAFARNCAFRKPFVVGLDTAGRPVTKTAVFTVKFTR